MKEAVTGRQEVGPDGFRVGERILIRRRRAKLSRDDLGELAGVARSTLQRYEGGESDVPAAVITRIARALGVSPNELLGYSGNGITLDQLSALEAPVAA